ncbi:NAD(P)/FAD-dependent oxidoreductase [Cupriavidus consociatus]|uniref:NAD(P)/FAD-dependent oxidoreductase n=1 Tax=Cupriavidus consociatus TaxID=2821357 RepID=UPI001AE74A16|nr:MULTISPECIES: FAD-dependent oxidoreductase [unclassified Cupriavidus]MBP0619247.1 FAD-dependent oxidoreductase [Cupriavidus sp. LEh25]MDK2655894.1 FAD-dependent oxidoreductase [Cupriavidus sp. LEh21]
MSSIDSSVGMYPTYQQRSGWNAMLPPRRPRTLAATRRFGIIVIGGGYTGLAAARRVAELRPNEQVLVLEAATVGEGSSGRNSGFIINVPHNTRMGGHTSPVEVARKQIRMYDAGLRWLEQAVREHGIDCGWNPIGKFHAAASEAGVENLQATLSQYRDWGVAYTEFDRSALEQKLGTSYYRYGYHAPNNVFVQPAALIRGLADSLPANVLLAENEPVVSLSHAAPFKVRTIRAEYTADRVMLANNGFAKALGILRDRLITIFTYAAVTPRLPEAELAKLGDAAEWGVIPANRLGTTLRRIRDGRFMVRSAYSYEREQSSSETLALLTQSYQRRYPDMRSHQFEYVWGGTTALTRNGATFFGQIKPGLFASLGCNGAGVLKGSTYGRLLGELALDEHSSYLADALSLEGPSWLPPEPFRRIGVVSAIRYQASQAGPER